MTSNRDVRAAPGEDEEVLAEGTKDSCLPEDDHERDRYGIFKGEVLGERLDFLDLVDASNRHLAALSRVRVRPVHLKHIQFKHISAVGCLRERRLT